MTEEVTITVTRTVKRVCDTMPLTGKITKAKRTLQKSPVTDVTDTPRIKQAKKTNSIVVAPVKSPERLHKPKKTKAASGASTVKAKKAKNKATKKKAPAKKAKAVKTKK